MVTCITYMGLCRQVNMRWWVLDPSISVPQSTTPFYRIWVPLVNLSDDDPVPSIHQRDRAHLFAVITKRYLKVCWFTADKRTKIVPCFHNIIFTIFMKMICNVLNTSEVHRLCLICQRHRYVSWQQHTENQTFRSLTLRRWTAFLVIRNAGGSGALARKSSIREFTGAKSFVWRQSSCNKQNNIN